jgi:hypothetical protein
MALASVAALGRGLPGAAPRAAGAQRRAAPPRRGVTAASTAAALVPWLAAEHGALPARPRAERARGGKPGAGWSLRATEAVAPGEVILSVPLDAAVSAADAADGPAWSAEMAASFLLRADADLIAPWLAALPAHVPLPWLYWTAEELAELQDGATLREAALMRGALAAARAAAPPGAEASRVAWALSLVHSRSFLDGPHQHLWVPGIDLCNHARAPSAAVRTVHSPDACQGAAAAEEVAPPAPRAPSRLELVAGPEGLAAGEEVTISYGAWPNDVLLLFFGFVEEGNPHDTVELFADLEELADFCCALAAERGGGESCLEPSALLAALEGELGGGDWARLAAAAGGLDARLAAAAGAAARLAGGLDPAEALRRRCATALAAAPTSLAQDEALLERGSLGGALETAVRYRLGKKRILRDALAQL